MSEATPQIELLGLYSIAGEGLIAEISDDDAIALYDKQGLQYRIVTRKQAGLPTEVEERALFQINSFNNYI